MTSAECAVDLSVVIAKVMIGNWVDCVFISQKKIRASLPCGLENNDDLGVLECRKMFWGRIRVLDICGQATKGMRGMSWC